MLSVLAQRLKESRTKKGLSQAEVGNILEVANTTVSGWETDYSEPSIKQLINLANMYNVSVEYLIGNSDIPIMPKLQETLLSYQDKPMRILYAAQETGLSEDVILQLLEDLARIRKSVENLD